MREFDFKLSFLFSKKCDLISKKRREDLKRKKDEKNEEFFWKLWIDFTLKKVEAINFKKKKKKKEKKKRKRKKKKSWKKRVRKKK